MISSAPRMIVTHPQVFSPLRMYWVSWTKNFELSTAAIP